MVNVLGNELSNAPEARYMGLPLVGYFPLIVACRADTVGKVFVGAEISKKSVECRLRDCFAKSPDRPVGHSATKANCS